MDWQEFDDETRKLARMIHTKPDMIIGISRGGVIPAALLAKILDVREMHSLSTERKGETRQITADIFTDVSKKKILLVEDIIETGRSLIAGKKFLEERGAHVITACLYTMPHSEIKPDYSLKEIAEVAQFPWNQ